MDSSQDFRDAVIGRLSRIETLLTVLVGEDGNDGVVASLNRRVRFHDRALWLFLGGGAIIGFALRALFHF